MNEQTARLIEDLLECIEEFGGEEYDNFLKRYTDLVDGEIQG